MKPWTKEQVAAICVQEAALHYLPVEILVGCAIAEAGLRWDAERWGRHSNAGRAAAEAGDCTAIQGVLLAMRADGTPHDVSFGCAQFIVISVPYGDHTYSCENVLLVRRWLFDPRNAVRAMADRLAIYYRQMIAQERDDPGWRALCKYNWPAGNGAPYGAYGAGENYRRAIAQAPTWIAAAQGVTLPDAAEGDDVSQQAIEDIRAILDNIYATASAYAINGQTEEADRLFTWVDGIIAAYPPIGRG